jgi:hypothetical protein
MAIFRGVGGSGDSSDNSFLDEVTAQAQAAEASATAAANSATSALNTELTSASFNTSNGVLTLTKQDGDTVTTDLDGRFLLTESNDLSSSVTWANVPNANITQSSVTQHQAALSITESQISDLQSYLTSYTETDPVFSAHAASNVTSTKITNWDSAYNDKITAVNYSGTTLTLTQQDGGTLTATIAGGGGTATGVDLADNVKATFGADDDLEIYHQSSNSNSIIKESGGGILSLQTNGSEIGFFDTANNQHIAWFKTGAECSLRYDGDEKFKTTSTGIDVTGTVTADGLTVDGEDNYLTFNTSTSGVDGKIFVSDSLVNNSFHVQSDNHLYLNSNFNDNGTGTVRIVNGSGANKIAEFAENGDISFYEDTGTTPKFFWDASAESLGIGTTSPARKLTVQGGSGDNLPVRIVSGSGTTKSHMEFQDASTTADYKVTLGSVGDGMSFQAGGSERMRINSAGNVGIGTNSPSSKLTVVGDIEQTTGDLKYTGGINWDIAHQGAGQNIVFSTTPTGGSATQRMRITSDGNVGIGTSSPTESKLVVDSGTTDAIATFKSSDTGGYIQIQDGDTSSVVGVGAVDNELILYSNNVARVTVDDTGNVGIGETNPATELDVSGDITLSGSINGNTIFKSPTGSTEYARFTSGYLGIGKSSPFVKLHVQGTSQGSGCSVTQNTTAFFDSQSGNYIGIGGGSTSTLGINFGDSTDADSGRILYRNSIDQMAFFTLANERMTIDQSGNVGVGTTTPLSRMHLTRYGSSSGVAPNTGSALFLDDASSTILQMGAAWYGANTILFGRGAGNGNSADNDIGSISYSNYFNYLSFKVNGSDRMQINSSGNLGINTTSPTEKLDVNSDKIRLRNSNTPSSATSTGNKGEICYDSNYVYICVATNTWKRAALASW